MVPGRLVLGVLVVDEIGILDAVAVDHREAVDVGLLGDGASFVRRKVCGCRLAQSGGQQRGRGQYSH